MQCGDLQTKILRRCTLICAWRRYCARGAQYLRRVPDGTQVEGSHFYPYLHNLGVHCRRGTCCDWVFFMVKDARPSSGVSRVPHCTGGSSVMSLPIFVWVCGISNRSVLLGVAPRFVEGRCPWCSEGEVTTSSNLNPYGGSGSRVRWGGDQEDLFGERCDPKLIVSLSLGPSALLETSVLFG